MKLLSRAGSLSVSTAGGHGERLGSSLWARWCGPEVLGLELRGLGLLSALQPNSAGQVVCKLGGSGIGGPARATSGRDLTPGNLKRKGKGLESGGEATRWRDLWRSLLHLGARGGNRESWGAGGRRRPSLLPSPCQLWPLLLSVSRSTSFPNG